MSFLLPWAWGFLALVPVVVALYLLKVRRRQTTVSTLLFWRKILEENRRRALFQRLRRLLSLLLFLLILLLLLLALAKPVIGRFFRGGVSTVLVLDRRVSMQAVRDGQSTFDRAREEALALVRQSDELRPTAILLAGGETEIASPFSSDAAALAGLLGKLQPTDAGGSLENGLALARQIAQAQGRDARVVVLTADGRIKSADGLEVVQVGHRANNVAIIAFAARPTPSSPETFSVLLRVRNFSEERRSGTAEITLDGATLDVRPFDLAPGGTFSVNFPLVPKIAPQGRGWLRAQLSPDDALAADNVAYSALALRAPARVLLVTSGNWFLENLLRADTSIQFELLEPGVFRTDMAGGFDAVILDDVALPDFDPARAEGNWLLIGRAGAGAATTGQPLVREADAESPLLRQVDLTPVTFLRAAAPQLPGGDAWRIERPVMGVDAPLIATAEQVGATDSPRRLAYFGFGIGDSDLPLRVAFPLLVSNTLQWLTDDRVEEPQAVRAGEVIMLSKGETIADRPGAGEFQHAMGTFTPLAAGFYQTKRAARSRWIAVNTFAPESSDLRDLPEPDISARATAALPALATWPLWYCCAAAALFLLLAEWFLFQRGYTE